MLKKKGIKITNKFEIQLLLRTSRIKTLSENVHTDTEEKSILHFTFL